MVRLGHLGIEADGAAQEALGFGKIFLGKRKEINDCIFVQAHHLAIVQHVFFFEQRKMIIWPRISRIDFHDLAQLTLGFAASASLEMERCHRVTEFSVLRRQLNGASER